MPRTSPFNGWPRTRGGRFVVFHWKGHRKPSGSSPERAQTPQSSAEGGVMETRNCTRARGSGNSQAA
eukprot:220425-Rhodomonas_salina.2